jgi:hypothetical protein
MMSVSPTIRPHGTTRLPWGEFSWNLWFEYFSKICQKIQLSLKSDKNSGYLREDKCIFLIKSHSLLRMRSVSYKSSRGNENTFHPQFFFFNRAVNEIMWKNIVELDRPQMTIWCLCIACWIPKAKNTYSEYHNTFCFPLQQWLHVCTSVSHFIYCIYCLSSYNRGGECLLCGMNWIFKYNRLCCVVEVLRYEESWICWEQLHSKTLECILVCFEGSMVSMAGLVFHALASTW